LGEARERAVKVRPFRYVYNNATNKWERTYDPKRPLKPGESPVFSPNFPESYKQDCTRRTAAGVTFCVRVNICEGKLASECFCYNDGSCSQSFCRGKPFSCGKSIPATPPYVPPPPPLSPSICPNGRCPQNACCTSKKQGRVLCCPDCFGGGARPPYGFCSGTKY